MPLTEHLLKISILSLNEFHNSYYKGSRNLILILFFGDVNVLIILFLILLTTLTTHVNTSLHLLLTAELIWITLYALVLLLGFIYDNLHLLSLTFFFLIFSAVEFSVGLVLLLLQHLLLRTLSLDSGGNTSLKFTRQSNNGPKTNLLLLKV